MLFSTTTLQQCSSIISNQGCTNSSGAGEIQFLSYTESADCGDLCELYLMNFLIVDEDGLVQYQIKQTSTTGTSSSTLDFSKVKELRGRFPVRIRTRKRVSISFEVWDEDWGYDDHLRDMVEMYVPFSNNAVGDGWTQTSYISSDLQAVLTIMYRLTSCDTQFTGLGCDSCAEFYHTPQCDKYCRPKAGFYTCSWSGEKVCNERRTGEQCHECVRGFTGLNCMSCAANFYPDGLCHVYCLPDEYKYNCSADGKKLCFGNRAGSDCETCLPDYYGTDCSVLCNETTNHRCDTSGNKICKEHYYPEGKCDTLCQPVPENFTCNLITGEKICVKNKTGKNCDQCRNGKMGAKCDTCVDNYEHVSEGCKEYCRRGGRYWCSETGVEVCLSSEIVVANDCKEGSSNSFNNCTSTTKDCDEWKTGEKNASTGKKVGIGATIILVLLLIGAIIFALVIRYKKKRGRNKNNDQELGQLKLEKVYVNK